MSWLSTSVQRSCHEMSGIRASLYAPFSAGNSGILSASWEHMTSCLNNYRFNMINCYCSLQIIGFSWKLHHIIKCFDYPILSYCSKSYVANFIYTALLNLEITSLYRIAIFFVQVFSLFSCFILRL